MSDLVFSVFAFHALATVVWLAVCAVGACLPLAKRTPIRSYAVVAGATTAERVLNSAPPAAAPMAVDDMDIAKAA